MNVISKIYEQDLDVTQDTIVFGQIIGNVSVQSGCELFIKGLILGDVLLEINSKCTIHGTVIGQIKNAGGFLVVGGLINGEILTEAGTTKIEPDAKVLDTSEKDQLKSLSVINRDIITENLLNFS